MKRSLLIVLLLLSMVGGMVNAQDDPGTIVEVAGGLDGVTTLASALGLADPAAVEALAGEGPFTLFAPNDDAFSAFGTDQPEMLSEAMADTELLTGIFMYHVVPGSYDAATLAEELEASEEGVLELETLLPGFSIMVTADDDGNVLVNGNAVVSADNMASNGVVHVIEGVLIPLPAGTIVEVAGALEGVTTLASALGLADPAAIEALAEEGPFTLFAPNDDAFSAFGTDQPELLSQAMGDTELLTGIFMYHIVPGAYDSETLAEELEASEEGVLELPTLLEGTTLEVTADDDGNILVNGIAVVSADNLAGNGVVHVIEGVLVPVMGEEGASTEPMGSIVDVAGGLEGVTTLASALGLADPAAIEALAGEGPFTLFAPNDDAFSAFGTAEPELLSSAMADTELLTGIFMYHIVPGAYDSATLAEELEADDDGTLELPTLLEGAMLEVTADDDGNILVNGIMVVAADNAADNGVVHVIEGVLVPPMPE